MSAGSHRLFFALFPDPGTRRKIENVYRQLSAECGARGRPVKPDQYHVTLAFLGKQPVERLPLLLAIASSLDMPACRVAFDCLGGFPRSGVAWLGATELPPELCAFQARLLAELERAQIAFDPKPWKFHLTLYRDLRKPCVRMDPSTVSWNLNDFYLVESISVDRGVEYRQLGRWKAGSSANVHRKV